ncbi:FxsA family membrane protein [Streptomyces sp. HNM0574]|uniref:FxsA family membrane protein n=1 Tax=Streptomyces sp. HNM0574 TaxID=2714954 RepID=UPI00146A5E81|nr:FxsA family membrane protein [Streptomyces sp. HNM0574]NLU69304.1 FxsA family protein [Streptomyces sp. HNM0574]
MNSRAPYPQEQPRERPGQDGGPGGPGSTPEGPGGRRRLSARGLIPLGVAAWALLEIWLFTLVAEAAGGLTVLLLIVAGFVLGAVAIKRAGRRAWSNLTDAVQKAQAQSQGKPDESAGGEQSRTRGGNALAMLGGLLIMVPGLVSDVAGLLCLFPPTAALMRRLTRGWFERRGAFAPGSLGDAYQQARTAEEQMRIHRPDGKVVEGEVIEGSVVREDEPPRG